MKKNKNSLDSVVSSIENRISDDEMTPDRIIELQKMFLSEWEHRDSLLWKQVFKFFYVVIIVLFLPNVASYLHISVPDFPLMAFPIISFFLSIGFIYVSFGYAKRLEAVSKSYIRLLDMLPEGYGRLSLDDKEIKFGRLFKPRIASYICGLMFLSSALLSLHILFQIM